MDRTTIENSSALVQLILCAYDHMQAHAKRQAEYSPEQFREMFCTLHVGTPRAFGATWAANNFVMRSNTLIVVANRFLARNLYNFKGKGVVATAEGLSKYGERDRLKGLRTDIVLFDVGGMTFREYCETAEMVNHALGNRMALRVTLGQPRTA